jgi:anti-sigma B factor antagonist
MWHAGSDRPNPADNMGGCVEISVSRTTAGNVPIVAVNGELDVSSAPGLKDKFTELIQSGEATMIVDLSGVGFLDSTGLGALVEARAASAGAGGSLFLVCSQDRILKLFTITGLDDVFTIHPSVSDAVAGLRG